jgi:hypothetical protein
VAVVCMLAATGLGQIRGAGTGAKMDSSASSWVVMK